MVVDSYPKLAVYFFFFSVSSIHESPPIARCLSLTQHDLAVSQKASVLISVLKSDLFLKGCKKPKKFSVVIGTERLLSYFHEVC